MSNLSLKEDILSILLRESGDDEHGHRVDLSRLISLLEDEYSINGIKISRTYPDTGFVNIVNNELEDLYRDGLIDKYGGESLNQSDFYITNQGIDEILNPVESIDADAEVRSGTARPIDSTSWTGLSKYGTLGEADVLRLKEALANVDHAVEVSSASNEEKAQARAYILALKALADAPEPPADLMLKIVMLLAALGGMGSFVTDLVELFS